MKNLFLSRLLAALLVMLYAMPGLWGQGTQDPECTLQISDSIVPRAAFFNYGNGNKMKNSSAG
ncbi:MAG: hypothetical protein IPL65_03705 [Lewinellaceae bacterium]|nr:hypothetical protein [Lewinellaceae bacterium]